MSGIRRNRVVAVLCSLALVPSTVTPTLAQNAAPSAAPPQQASAGTEQRPDAPPAPKVPNEQIDSLVAPIALYPDPLLAQVLAASTYPLELVELQQWLVQHADLKGEALVEAVKKMDWDPSVQGLAAVPDAVKLLASNIKWTTELGNVFLAQEADVMAAVQRMRVKAKDKGALKSNEQMKVETKEVDDQTVVVIEQADPQVVYVPAYSPTVVYGPAPVYYAYPHYAYPPGYVAGTAMISFGIGIAMGAAFSGGWGYSCGWGGGHHSTYVNVNRNNTFVRNSSAVRTGGRSGTSGRWEHNPRHRGGAPYRDRATADRFGARDASRGPRTDNRGRQGSGGRGIDAANRPGGADRPGGDRGMSTSANQIGDRRASLSAGYGPETRGEAFSGGKQGGYSGSNARSSSARGSASMGSRGGGGHRGGGRGGGGRGGGGRR
jgi:hypothetical protein